jgi:hypothetical protein
MWICEEHMQILKQNTDLKPTTTFNDRDEIEELEGTFAEKLNLEKQDIATIYVYYIPKKIRIGNVDGYPVKVGKTIDRKRLQECAYHWKREGGVELKLLNPREFDRYRYKSKDEFDTDLFEFYKQAEHLLYIGEHPSYLEPIIRSQLGQSIPSMVISQLCGGLGNKIGPTEFVFMGMDKVEEYRTAFLEKRIRVVSTDVIYEKKKLCEIKKLDIEKKNIVQ